MANENPARVENATTEIAVTDATMTELVSAFQNWMSEVSTRPTFSKKCFAGTSDGTGFCAIVWASEEPSRNE